MPASLDCYPVDKVDLIVFWLLNVSSSFMLSAAHNVFFFVLDIRTPVIHFLHFFCAFLFFVLKILVNEHRGILTRCPFPCVASRRKCLMIVPVVVTQLIVTTLSSRVHSQNRTGALYLIRIFDFLTTLVVLRLTAMNGSGNRGDTKNRYKLWSLVGPVALSASLSWLEFGHVEYDSFALLLAPVLAVAQAVQLVLLRKAQIEFYSMSQKATSPEGRTSDQDEVTFDHFCLYYTGLCSLALVTPALISYAQSVISYDASWESIDYVLIGCSGIFMCGYKYSELWLQTYLELHDFCVFQHTKFFMASCGQWFLQNMAHATIFAMCGKVLFVASLFRYLTQIGEKGSLFWKKENEA